nr:odorant receptor 6 [Pachyrhinus yasumatsui]
MVGIEDRNIIIEAIGTMFDYVGYIYIFICFRLKISKFKLVLKDISIFLKYCEPSVIINAEKVVHFYTKCLIVYTSIGLLISCLVQIVDLKSCKEKRLSDFYKKYDPCGLPLRVLYPLDTTVTINFLLSYILGIFACVVVSFGVLGINMTLIGLLIHIIAQIQYCKNLISKVFKNKNDFKGLNEETFFRIKRQIIFCIKYHQAIIRYTQRVYAIYSALLLVHITLTSAIFGIILYRIASNEEKLNLLRYYLELAGWIGTLFLTCYYGQRIITESNTIADAAYESFWYNAPLNLQRHVKLIIMRGQRPLTLRVASIGVISLETFVAVLKTAYSFFALLITISN